MDKVTNFYRLQNLSEEEFAKFLCHVAQSSKLIMDEIDDVLEKYKSSEPPDYACMLAWLRTAKET